MTYRRSGSGGTYANQDDIRPATTTHQGLMSAADKAKLTAQSVITSITDPLLLSAGALRLGFSGVSVTNNAALVVPTGAGGLVATFNTEYFDNGSYHSTVSNTNRLTVPYTGFYQFTFQAQFAVSVAGTWRIATIRNQATTPLAVDSRNPQGGGAVPTRLTVSTGPVLLTAGDWVEVLLQQDSGGNLNVNVVGNESPLFGAYLLGVV